MTHPTLLPTLVLAIAASLGAQDASQAPAVDRLSTSTPLATTAFRTPLHTQPRDQRLGDYGLWAGGTDFKASFHDGFTFYPLVGPASPNLPWRWTTTGITVGDEPFVDVSRRDTTHSEWRCEYRSDGVTEAYDLRAEGVEQTFVLTRRPIGGGDVVIEGSITTALETAAVPAAVRELVFTDAHGVPRVRYGKATAIAADGASVPVTTAFDGKVVRLAIPGAWLAQAALPVVVDPLTSAIVLDSTVTGAAPQQAAIHRQDETAQNTVAAFVREFAAGDLDMLAVSCTADFQAPRVLFSDITTAWSTMTPDVTFVGGVDRWVVTMWRHTVTEDRLRCYFHDRDALQANSGPLDSSYNPGTEHVSFPTVGGSSNPTQGGDAIAVYRMDPFFGNSAVSQVHAATIDAANGVITGRQIVENVDDCDNPDVNCQLGWGENGWVVVYGARSSATDDYDVYARRVTLQPQATVSARIRVGPDNLGDKMRAVVQGWDGRYLVAMLQDVGVETNGVHFARNVLTARLDWTAGASPIVAPHRITVTYQAQEVTHLALGYDGTSRSHWALLYDSGGFTSPPATTYERLGATGGLIEHTPVGFNRYHGAVSWNGVDREFQIITCANNATGSLLGQRLSYPTQAWNLEYGLGCGPATIGSTTVPVPGSEFYRVELAGAPPQQIALLCYSGGSAAVPLGTIGAPNCWMNLASLDVTLAAVTDNTGAAGFTIALPDAPLFLGDLYWQFVYTWPAAPTPLAIGATKGLRASVR